MSRRYGLGGNDLSSIGYLALVDRSARGDILLTCRGSLHGRGTPIYTKGWAMKELGGSRIIQPPMKVADGIAYLMTLPTNEPIFILRGQDSLAYATVLDWAQRAERHGVAEEKICGAVAVAADMMQWKTRRLPD